MRKTVNKLLAKFDVQLVKKSSFDKLIENRNSYRDWDLANAIDPTLLVDFIGSLPFSKSQLRQDLFALSESGFKRGGFFVEFGATNGVTLSNSHLLETRFGWQGILAEPARLWHAALARNRSAKIETDCVWTTTGETVLFNEVGDEGFGGALSTINSFSEVDMHRDARSAGKKYEVKTISLVDLLKKYAAPKQIDYLSIDTEGSEFEILNAFDFDQFDIKVITCEHNHTPMRQKIFDMLTSKGYERKLTDFSQFDDWYVRRGGAQ